MAAGAGLDARLAPFIAGYVLVLAVLGPIVAGRAHVLAGWLRAAGRLLPGTGSPAGTGSARSEAEEAGQPVSAAVPSASRADADR